MTQQSKDLQRMKESFFKLNKDITDFLHSIKYYDYDDLSYLIEDPFSLDPEERLLYNTFRKAAESLEDFRYQIEPLTWEPEKPEKLHKTESGRYMTSRKCYTSGYSIEYLCEAEDYPHGEDELKPVKQWERSSIEHNGEDYYIVKRPGLPLEGLTIRERRGTV